ncbi:oligosaccharide flippase family protein [Aciduliprofundum sp. MAR08-339]|uniref:oligosaccharide flippase family protein n=1 Tax=Aciduliprofundum sp. (strain MAR08-339) TaxID=673860 RepID=UPI00138A67F2
MDIGELKAISGIAIGNVITQILRFIFWFIVVWMVTPEKYGYIRYAFTIANFFLLPAASGFPAAITKFISENLDDKKKMKIYAFQTIFIDFVMILITTSIAIGFGIFLPYNIPIISSIFILITGLYYLYISYIRGLIDVRRLIGFGVSVSASRVVLIILFWLMNLQSIFWILFAYSLPLFIGILSMELLKEKTVKFEIFHLDRSILLEIIIFAVPGILSTTLWTITGQVDIVFIKSYYGYSVVGSYSLAKTITSLIGFVNGAIIVLQMPKVSSFKKNHKYIYNYTKKSLKIGFLATSIFAIMLYVFVRSIFDYLFPSAYKNSIPLIYIMIPGMIFAGLFSILAADWTGYGKPIENAKIMFFGMIFVIGLDFLLVPLYGSTGAAVVYTLSQCFIFILMYIKTMKYFRA